LILSDPETSVSETLHASRNLLAFPSLSPSGHLLAYFSEVEPRERLYVMPLDRSERPRQLNIGSPSQALVMPAWRSDDQLSFYENLETQSVQTVAPEGGPPRLMFADFSWERNMWLDWSPDGSHAAFVRIDPTNPETPRVFVREIDTAAEWPMHAEMRSVPDWSNDGASLLGMGARGIVICPLTGEQCEQVVERPGISFPRWSSDNSRVFFVQRSRSLPSGLWRELRVVDRNGESDRHLMNIGPLHPIGGPFQVLPDDRIVWTQHIEGEIQILRAEVSD
jgi:Tol biopolymer transport system component